MAKKCSLNNVLKDVKQFYKGKLLKPSKSDNLGHLSVHIGFQKKKWNVGVHRLVLMAFVGECPEGMEACHNNGNASDNRIENLRWDTHANNNNDRKIHGTYALGEKHPASKITKEMAKKIINNEITPKEASLITGLPYKLFWRIKSGETWSHVKD